MSEKDLNRMSSDCGEDAAPYVLGALTDEEHEAFLVHLESCAVCRDEVAALSGVASVLPAAVPQLAVILKPSGLYSFNSNSRAFWINSKIAFISSTVDSKSVR